MPAGQLDRRAARAHGGGERLRPSCHDGDAPRSTRAWRGRASRGLRRAHAEETQQLLYRILSSEQQKHLELDRQLDFSYSIPGLARFRVNAYFQRESIGAAFRLIPDRAEDAGGARHPGRRCTMLAEKPRGLVLVTGPTGSGKSTTLAAIIDEINRNRSEHILTIEDPIEFLHRHKRCIVNQREIGPDAHELRRGAARRAASGPRRDPRRRDARPRDDLDRADRGRDGPPRASARCTRRARRRRSTASSTSFLPSSRSRCASRSRTRSQGVVTQALLPTPDRTGRVAGARDPAPGRRGAEPHPPGQGRADLLRHADEHGARHADDGAVARRSDPAPRRRLRRRSLAFEPARPADRVARARRASASRSRRLRARQMAPLARPSGRRKLAMSDDIDLEEGDLVRAQAQGRAARGRNPTGDEPTSFWKKEISLTAASRSRTRRDGGRRCGRQSERAADFDLKKELSFGRKQRPSPPQSRTAQPKPAEPVAEQRSGRRRSASGCRSRCRTRRPWHCGSIRLRPSPSPGDRSRCQSRADPRSRRGRRADLDAHRRGRRLSRRSSKPRLSTDCACQNLSRSSRSRRRKRSASRRVRRPCRGRRAEPESEPEPVGAAPDRSQPDAAAGSRSRTEPAPSRSPRRPSRARSQPSASSRCRPRPTARVARRCSRSLQRPPGAERRP